MIEGGANENSAQRFQLEVCVGSLTDAEAAAEAGADRLELCSALSLGGLTPSWGTIAGIKEELALPLMVMIRPRESGFCYDEREFSTMCRDAEAAIRLGADGLVFGVLQADGSVDAARCRRLVEIAEGRTTVFHRAFDVVRRPLEALETLIGLGTTRILTSGQQPSAVEGRDLIRQLRARAAGRIEILPAGGLHEANVRDFLQHTRCDQVHMGLATLREDTSIGADCPVRFTAQPTGPERVYRAVHPERVRAVASELRRMD